MKDHDVVRLDDPVRIDALRRCGLDAAPDDAFDRFAELAVMTLHAPVALVSLVDDRRQFFPGAVGLGEPWQARRETPLTHSFYQIVVETAQPLIIQDARTDPRLHTSPAITDLGVIAYAGMPLTDSDGTPLGSLCVIDHEPRVWSEQELATLHVLAAACSSELRLRITASRAAEAEAHRQRWSEQVSRSLEASEATAAAETVAEITAAVSTLVPGPHPPAFAALGVCDPTDELVHLVAPDEFTAQLATRWLGSRTADTPLRRCIAEGRQIAYATQADLLADFPALEAEFTRLGWQALICTPLRGDRACIGALVFAWTEPHARDLAEHATIMAFTGYATQALQRVQR